MPGFVLRPRARADLDGIWDYTAQHWSAEQADRYARLIAEACDGLAAGTIKGRSAEAIRPGYLKLPVGSHILFYRVGGDGAIDVVRILHQRMDIERQL